MKTNKNISCENKKSGIYNPKNLVKRLILLKDEPKKISLGYALGIFMGTTPFIGLKLLIAVFIASLFNWNKIATCLGVMLINPLTGPFFHGIAYVLGKGMLGITPQIENVSVFNIHFISNALQQGNQVLLALLSGGFVLGLPMSFIAYVLSYKITKHRNRNWKPSV